MKVVVGTFNKKNALGTVKLREDLLTALGDTVPSPAAAAAVKFNDRRRVTRTALHRGHHHQPRSNQFDGSGMTDSYLYLY